MHTTPSTISDIIPITMPLSIHTTIHDLITSKIDTTIPNTISNKISNLIPTSNINIWIPTTIHTNAIQTIISKIVLSQILIKPQNFQAQQQIQLYPLKQHFKIQFQIVKLKLF